MRGSFRLCYTDVAFRQDLTMSAALGRLLEFVRLQSAGSPQRAPWSGNVIQESKVLKQFTKAFPLLTLQTTDIILQIFLCSTKAFVIPLFCSFSARCKRIRCQATVILWPGAVGFCAPVIDTLSTFSFYWHLWEFQAVRNVGDQSPSKSSFEGSTWSLSFSLSKAACVMPTRATAFVPWTSPGDILPLSFICH